MYMATLGRLKFSKAYATPALYSEAEAWQVVSLELVTKLRRESGSMIRATATCGAVLMAATIAIHSISI
jgi:hypothetical protein